MTPSVLTPNNNNNLNMSIQNNNILANTVNMNKFNFNPHFIQPQPLSGGYMINYPQTPQNGVRAFNFPNNNIPQNNFIQNSSNNNFIPMDIKHSNNSNFSNNNNISSATNKKTCMNDVKINFNNRDEQIDFKINLENIILGRDKRTTIMLRNIPNKYSLSNLVEEINNMYFGKIDYINLPIDYEVYFLLIFFLIKYFIILKIEKIKFGLCFC